MGFLKKFLFVGLIIVLFIVGYFLASGNAEKDKPYKISAFALGTIVEIQVRGDNKQAVIKSCDSALAEIKRIDSMFSVYSPGSILNIVNSGSDTVVTLPAEIYNLILKCDTLHSVTGGTLDVTLGSLINLWGFGPDGTPSVPTKGKITEALATSGWNKIEILDSNRIKKNAGTRFNFGAVIAGYAADRAIKVLKKFGIKDALVNTGGEIKTVGSDWAVGIQHPRVPGTLITKIKPGSKSVSTSGDYEQYFETNGGRYCHIFNPVSGYPASGCRSVTILADDALTADAFSTAVFIMGPEKGVSFVESQPGIECMIIDSLGNVSYSNGFKNYLLRN